MGPQRLYLALLGRGRVVFAGVLVARRGSSGARLDGRLAAGHAALVLVHQLPSKRRRGPLHVAVRVAGKVC